MAPSLDEVPFSPGRWAGPKKRGEDDAGSKPSNMNTIRNTNATTSELQDRLSTLYQQPEKYSENDGYIAPSRPIDALKRHENPVCDPDAAEVETQQESTEQPRCRTRRSNHGIFEKNRCKLICQQEMCVCTCHRGKGEDQKKSARTEAILDRPSKYQEVNDVSNEVNVPPVKECMGKSREYRRCAWPKGKQV